MNDHKKFLKLLAKEINSGADKFSFERLKTHLLDAVIALPDGNLKDILQKESLENSEYLWNLVKPAKKCSEIQFNIFNKDGLEEMLRKISQLHSHKEQIRYLSQLALCYPCNKVFELLLTAQRMDSPDQSHLEVLNKVTELYGRLTVGCHNFEVLHGLLEVFLSEIDRINDKLKTSNESQERWLDLKDIIHRFVVHCHVKRQTRELDTRKGDDVVTSIQQTKYRDALAAVIAIYIDVVIAIGQVNEDVSNHLSNLVYLMLGDSPSHILDAANQIFTLDSTTINIVFPFLRKVFHSTRTSTAKCENYIKYLCLARKVQHCVQDLEVETLYLKKNVCSLLPPENILTWLTNLDSSLIEDFQLSGLDGHKITDKILQCEAEEKFEKILDLTSSPGKLNEITEELELEENMTNEDESNVPLFFVDAEGSSELVEQCQEKQFTNSTSDKMLKKQIRILLEKLEETGSEDEKDDFDIKLDDDENETTLDFGDNNVRDDTESKSGDDEISDPKRNDSKEKTVEDESEINMTTLRKEDENLTQSGKIRKKRKSPGSSIVPEAERTVKSSKRGKLSKKRRS